MLSIVFLCCCFWFYFICFFLKSFFGKRIGKEKKKRRNPLRVAQSSPEAQPAIPRPSAHFSPPARTPSSLWPTAGPHLLSRRHAKPAEQRLSLLLPCAVDEQDPTGGKPTPSIPRFLAFCTKRSPIKFLSTPRDPFRTQAVQSEP